jgi:hypothetical protein
MPEGWVEYEWRWFWENLTSARRNFWQPIWRGEAAEDRTLLIHAEQGFGDALQFCRYAPLAAARGFRVILEAPAALIGLLGSLPGIDRLIRTGDELPPFDLHCPMLSLPLAFRTTLETIPASTAYLHADPALVEMWRTRIGSMSTGHLKVGLVWAGNPRSFSPALNAVDRRRSLAPEKLTALVGLPGVQLFSLQKNGQYDGDALPLVDFMAEVSDFADTAALISNLDLVITVDTAVVHLAAAVGKAVWMLDRFDNCWRWLTDRTDSPWYPSLKIYRQPQPGDWDPVLAKVACDLRRLAENRA